MGTQMGTQMGTCKRAFSLSVSSQAAFASIAGAAAAGSSGGAGPSSGGAGARPEAQVQNLGVVGRGQRRITLAPQPAAQRPQGET